MATGRRATRATGRRATRATAGRARTRRPARRSRPGRRAEAVAAETRDGLPALRRALVDVLRQRGYVRREEPFQLSSGEWSHDYVDGKRALAGGGELRLAAEAVIAEAADAGARFDSVGGLTMGADPLAHAVAVLTGAQWFAVRKQAKDHGKGRLIEGADIGPGAAALVLDDVVTTGRSLFQALDAVEATGAQVALAVTLLDRGDVAARELAARRVPYRPLTSYRDLGIEPVGRR